MIMDFRTRIREGVFTSKGKPATTYNTRRFIKIEELIPDGLNEFVRGLIIGINEYLLIEKEDRYSFKRANQATKDENLYLAPLEAIRRSVSKVGEVNDSLIWLEYGEKVLFNEGNYNAKIVKERTIYPSIDPRRMCPKDIAQGIVQIVYDSPEGSLIIQQRATNPTIFNVYISDDMSDRLKDRIYSAAAIGVGLELESFLQGLNRRIQRMVDTVLHLMK